MLRAFVLLLALANLAAYGWVQGWLAPWLPRAGDSEREPDRVARQVRPELVTVLGAQDARSAMADAARAATQAQARWPATSQASAVPGAPAAGGAAGPAAAATAASTATAAIAASTATAASAATAAAAATLPPSAASNPVAVATCLEAGPLAPAELAAADRSLRALQMPTLRWATVRTEQGGLFIVYMGRYTDRTVLQKKEDELRRLGVDYTLVPDAPPLMPGLELGRFNDRNAANAALAQSAQRGVKSARVAMLVAPTLLVHLRADKLDPAQAERLQALSLQPAGTRFKPCAAAR